MMRGLLPADTPGFTLANPHGSARIAFLLGCAEPAKDGVGDYTALLAAECERRGHRTMRIALNDRYASGMQESEGLLRLGALLEWDARVERAREAIERFEAEIVSLQWVPYAFDPRGLPWGLEKGLGRIFGGRLGHVMCHEIWIGAESGASLRHRATGAAQRVVMGNLLRTIRPACVHTSNPAYASALAKAGIQAEVLPMFGAIPVTGVEPARDPEVARFGLFGELHPSWLPEPLLGRLRELGRYVEVEHIGRIGKGDGLWREMELRYDGEFFLARHGEQPAAAVSQFLMDMDFGIATTPLALIGKSASAAAMLEHGLPLIVNRNDVQFADDIPKAPGVITMDESFAAALREAPRREPRSRLPEVADQFLESLRKVRGGAP